MLLTGLGIALLLLTTVLYLWGIPKRGETSRVPRKWGFAAVFPALVLCLAISGAFVLFKGLFP